MSRDLNELRAIEQLLQEAEERLGPSATFRQRTLLQMSLFELRRGLRAELDDADRNTLAESQSDDPDK